MNPPTESTGATPRDDGALRARSAEDKGPERKYRQLIEANERLLLSALTAQQEKTVAEHVQDAQRDFIAVMAHELRNPLAALQSSLEVLEAAPNDAVLMQGIRPLMARQVDHLTRMVGDLVSGAWVTDGSLVLQTRRVCLTDVIAQSVQTARPLIQAGGHDVALVGTDQSVYIQADEVRLSQVFSNLLSNACKYTPEPGAISVSVTPQHGEVIVAIRDSGVGLAPADMERVFDMFVRVGPLAERPQGMGIGLALVRRLVEMHGGSVAASSEGAGKGSTFVVRLPTVSHVPSDMS